MHLLESSSLGRQERKGERKEETYRTGKQYEEDGKQLSNSKKKLDMYPKTRTSLYQRPAVFCECGMRICCGC